jgi:flagellar basal body-associated protein FliL
LSEETPKQSRFSFSDQERQQIKYLIRGLLIILILVVIVSLVLAVVTNLLYGG